MKTKILLAALMLLAISCKKESTSIQSSRITGESSTQALSSEAKELAGLHAVNVGHYRNGDRIPQVQDDVKWSQLTTGAWCWYNNDSANGAVYGKLYNWYAVNDPRGLGPEGWHIPSFEEWPTDLGNNPDGKMKSTGTIETGTGLWHEPNSRATNSSGFTGLPGGFRDDDGTFGGIGNYGYWWSSTEYNTANAMYHYLSYNGGSVNGSYHDKLLGFSVRCIKD